MDKTPESRILLQSSKLYRGLKAQEIRLIEILPGSLADTVVIRLIHTVLHENRAKYDALSYVWGDKSDPVNIICDEYPLSVTKNLHTALVQLRRDRVYTPIWIDAVCINQEDLDERARQVRLMRQIYGNAETVYVWLGRASATTAAGVELLHRAYEIKERFPEKVKGGRPSEVEALGLPAGEDPAWRNVVEIFTRPWFTRVWVIQEVTVAANRVFLCGNFRIRQEAVQMVYRSNLDFYALRYGLMQHWPQERGGQYERLKNVIAFGIIAAYYARSGPCDLLSLLFLTRGFEATDPRDKIFALLGITSGAPTNLIDYSRNLEETLFETATALLTQSAIQFKSPLNILCSVDGTSNSPDLPSWVPEWHKAGLDFRPMSIIVQDRSSFNVGVSSFSISGKHLRIRGKIIDRIQTLTRDIPFPASARNYLFSAQQSARWRAWHNDISSTVQKLRRYPTGISLHEAQWRALCFNGGENHEPASADYSHSYEALKRVYNEMPAINSAGRMAEMNESLWQDVWNSDLFREPMEMNGMGRRFCVTQAGFCGWVHLAAREGDVVVALWGTRSLFTLRVVEGGYRLMGDCYLHGLMEGEGLRVQGVEDEDIVIV